MFCGVDTALMRRGSSALDCYSESNGSCEAPNSASAEFIIHCHVSEGTLASIDFNVLASDVKEHVYEYDDSLDFSGSRIVAG